VRSRFLIFKDALHSTPKQKICQRKGRKAEKIALEKSTRKKKSKSETGFCLKKMEGKNLKT